MLFRFSQRTGENQNWKNGYNMTRVEGARAGQFQNTPPYLVTVAGLTVSESQVRFLSSSPYFFVYQLTSLR